MEVIVEFLSLAGPIDNLSLEIFNMIFELLIYKIKRSKNVERETILSSIGLEFTGLILNAR